MILTNKLVQNKTKTNKKLLKIEHKSIIDPNPEHHRINT